MWRISDTDNPVLGQTSQVKGTVSDTIVLPSQLSHKLRGSQASQTSDQLATNPGIPMTPQVW